MDYRWLKKKKKKIKEDKLLVPSCVGLIFWASLNCQCWFCIAAIMSAVSKRLYVTLSILKKKKLEILKQANNSKKNWNGQKRCHSFEHTLQNSKKIVKN